MVVKVSDKDISTKERKTGETVSIPYGIVLWSTGIATLPVIKDFMSQIGQVRGSTNMCIFLFRLSFQIRY